MRYLVSTIAASAAVVLLGACGGEPTVAASSTLEARAPQMEIVSAPVRHDIDALRRAMAPFREFPAATAAGWSAKITSCMADPTGGMGFHYGNVGWIDGTVQVDKPELLLYEPLANGQMQLVAVEYVIPYTFRSRSGEPPKLFGQRFKQNDRFQLWGLHVWAWKENPSGTFANWNPRVTCANTDDLDVAPMSH